MLTGSSVPQNNMPIVGGKGAEAGVNGRRLERVKAIDPCLPISLNAFRQAAAYESLEEARNHADAEANEALDRVQYQILSESGKGFVFFEVEGDHEKDHLLRLSKASRIHRNSWSSSSAASSSKQHQKSSSSSLVFESQTYGCDTVTFSFLEQLGYMIVRAASWDLKCSKGSPPVDLIEDLLPTSANQVKKGGASPNQKASSSNKGNPLSRSILQIQQCRESNEREMMYAEVDVGVLSIACLITGQKGREEGGSIATGLQVRGCYENEWEPVLLSTQEEAASSSSGPSSANRYFLAVLIGRTLERATAGLYMATARRIVVDRPPVAAAAAASQQHPPPPSSSPVSILFSLRGRADAWLNPCTLSNRLKIGLPGLEFAGMMRAVQIQDYEKEIEETMQKEREYIIEQEKMEKEKEKVREDQTEKMQQEEVEEREEEEEEQQQQQQEQGQNKEEVFNNDGTAAVAVNGRLADKGAEEKGEGHVQEKEKEDEEGLGHALLAKKKDVIDVHMDVEEEQQQDDDDDDDDDDDKGAKSEDVDDGQETEEDEMCPSRDATSQQTKQQHPSAKAEEEEKKLKRVTSPLVDDGEVRKILSILPASTAAIAAEIVSRVRSSPATSVSGNDNDAVAACKKTKRDRSDDDNNDDGEQRSGEKRLRPQVGQGDFEMVTEVHHSGHCGEGTPMISRPNAPMIIVPAYITSDEQQQAYARGGGATATTAAVVFPPRQPLKALPIAPASAPASSAAAAPLSSTSSPTMPTAGKAGKDKVEKTIQQEAIIKAKKKIAPPPTLTSPSSSLPEGINKSTSVLNGKKKASSAQEMPPKAKSGTAAPAGAAGASSSSSKPKSQGGGGGAGGGGGGGSTKSSSSTPSSSTKAAASSSSSSSSPNRQKRKAVDPDVFQVQVECSLLNKVAFQVHRNTNINKMAKSFSERLKRSQKDIHHSRLFFTIQSTGRVLDKSKSMKEEGLQDGTLLICNISPAVDGSQSMQ